VANRLVPPLLKLTDQKFLFLLSFLPSILLSACLPCLVSPPACPPFPSFFHPQIDQEHFAELVEKPTQW